MGGAVVGNLDCQLEVCGPSQRYTWEWGWGLWKVVKRSFNWRGDPPLEGVETGRQSRYKMIYGKLFLLTCFFSLRLSLCFPSLWQCCCSLSVLWRTTLETSFSLPTWTQAQWLFRIVQSLVPFGTTEAASVIAWEATGWVLRFSIMQTAIPGLPSSTP